MRGEHAHVYETRPQQSGSSPHARGARHLGVGERRAGGIIPACAGSTSGRAHRGYRYRDHPRMRGEHCSDNVRFVSLGGSSPHARGARFRAGGPRAAVGIIPACAGSTSWTAAGAYRAGDHPRMRGEHDEDFDLTTDSEGSSPHARGALVDDGVGRAPDGIIPACAGSTGRATRSPICTRDHPRMRGEHVGDGVQIVDTMGSSPHARGAHHGVDREARPRGIIPACAGSTRRSRWIS